MLVVGLTGGIASGKSTVAAILAKAGAIIIDADRIARQVVTPGLPAWQEIRDLFGDVVLEPNGDINRGALGAIVFNAPQLRRQLEQIIHPRVGAEIDAQLRRVAQEQPDAVVIMDIPLLFETGRTQGLAEIIVVYTPEALQRQRLMARDHLSLTAAEARIRAQMPIAEKVQRATLTIDNSGSPADTERQTLAIFHRLAQRAAGAALS
ncbi:MAG: dephospho-CoA kinase [Desulfatitalea sp.]